MKYPAKIDKAELPNYVEYGELSAIPIICTGGDKPHRSYHTNTEPDSDSVYCARCGKVVRFAPLEEIIDRKSVV